MHWIVGIKAKLRCEHGHIKWTAERKATDVKQSALLTNLAKGITYRTRRHVENEEMYNNKETEN